MGKTPKFDHMKLIGQYAGGHKILITLGRIIAGVSAIIVLIPYYDIWKIISIAVNGEDLGQINKYAWQAVILVVTSLLIYIMRRIITLPLGVFDEDGTGKIRRIVNDSTAATETFIAHQLPDKTVAAVTPIGLLVLIFAFNWKIGLFCMIPAVLGFAVMMSMMGKGMQEKMAEYQNALETMSSEATEYVRGVPVVKTFGQTIHSFKRFKDNIDGFGKWATDYTLMLRFPMTAFMTCINSIFVFIVIAAFSITKDGTTAGDILNVMYYIIVTPLITVALTKVAYSGEAEMTLIDALKRVESIMEIEPLKDNKSGKAPADHGVELINVTYRYKDATRDAVKDVSMKIKPGEHVALVGHQLNL